MKSGMSSKNLLTKDISELANITAIKYAETAIYKAFFGKESKLMKCLMAAVNHSGWMRTTKINKETRSEIRNIQKMSKKLALQLKEHGHFIEGKSGDIYFGYEEFNQVSGIAGYKVSPDYTELKNVSLDLENISMQLRKLELTTKHFLVHQTKGKGGRNNSLGSFYEYIFLITQLYQEITKKDFSFDRKGRNIIATPGYNFAERAMILVNNLIKICIDHPSRQLYTPANLRNACDNANKKLGNRPRRKK